MAGGTSGGGDNDDEMITAINVTPLVDVVLVLLIILMVTASYIVSKSIPLNLPSAEGDSSATPPRVLSISIDASSNLFLDAEPISDATLTERANALVAEVGEAEARATIAADTATPNGAVVHVVELLRRAIVAHLAVNVGPAYMISPSAR